MATTGDAAFLDVADYPQLGAVPTPGEQELASAQIKAFNPILFSRRSAAGNKTWGAVKDCGFQTESGANAGVSFKDQQIFAVNMPVHMFKAAAACLSSVKAGSAFNATAMAGNLQYYNSIVSIMSLLFDSEGRELHEKVEPNADPKAQKKPKWNRPANSSSTPSTWWTRSVCFRQVCAYSGTTWCSSF